MKKKIISVLSTFLCIIGMSAQVPGSFQYQAVLRNDDGSIASNKPLEVRVRIHQGAADGTVVYEEDHTTSSNASGIITLKVFWKVLASTIPLPNAALIDGIS